MGGARAGTDAWGRICVGQPVDARMRAVVAARLPRGTFSQLERAPQGVVALIKPIEGNRPRIFVQRAGRKLVASLPKAPLPAGLRVDSFELTSEWPRPTLCGGVSTNPSGVPIRAPVWRSADGGRTWSWTFYSAADHRYCDDQTLEE